jgi:hypothetical protein
MNRVFAEDATPSYLFTREEAIKVASELVPKIGMLARGDHDGENGMVEGPLSEVICMTLEAEVPGEWYHVNASIDVEEIGYEVDARTIEFL